MKSVFFMLFACLCLNGFGQDLKVTRSTGEVEEIYFDRSEACDEERVFMVVGKMPQYRGGLQKLEADLNAALDLEKGIRGELYIRCTVNCKGEVFGFQKAKEAIASDVFDRVVIELMKLQNWKAGVNNGKQVDCFLNLHFKIKKGRILIK